MENKTKFRVIAIILVLVILFTNIISLASPIILEEIEKDRSLDEEKENIKEGGEKEAIVEESQIIINEENNLNKKEDNKSDNNYIRYINILTKEEINNKKIIDKDIGEIGFREIEGYILVSKDKYKVEKEEDIYFYYYPIEKNENISYTVIKHFIREDGKKIEIKDKSLIQSVKGIEIDVKDSNVKGFSKIDEKEIGLYKNIKFIEYEYKVDNHMFSVDKTKEDKKDIPTLKQGYLKLKDGLGNNLLNDDIVKKLVENFNMKNEEQENMFVKENNGEWKIKWIVELSNEISSKAKIYIDPYIYNEVMNKELSEYKLITENPLNVTLDIGENEAQEFIFEKQVKYKVNYNLLEENRKISPSIEGIIGLNNETEKLLDDITEKLIPGYEFFEKDIKNDNKNEINFNYRKSNAYNGKGYYYIRYIEVDEFGKEIGSIYEDELIVARPEIISKEKPYIIEKIIAKKPLELFKLKNREIKEDIELTGNGQEVVFEYEQDLGKINISFIDGSTGLPISSSIKKVGEIGAELNLLDPEINFTEIGYDLIENNLEDFRFTKEDQEISLIYENKNIVDTSALEIYFLDDYTNKIILRDSLKIPYKSDRNFINIEKLIENEKLESILGESDGRNYDLNRNVKYPDNIKLTRGVNKKLILRYKKEVSLDKSYREIDFNNEIKPRDSIKYYEGDFIDEKSIMIDGFLQIRPMRQFYPIIDDSNVVFRYRNLIESGYSKYKVRHIDKDTNESIAPDIEGSGKIGRPINIFAQKILGYELVGSNEISFRIEEGKNEFVFEYKRKDIEDNHYIIRYRDIGMNGKIYGNVYPNKTVILTDEELPKTETIKAKKAPRNYTLIGKEEREEEINISGQFINIDYKKNKSDVAIYFLDKEDRTGIKSPEVYTFDIGDEIDIEIPEVKGYKPIKDEKLSILVDREDEEFNIWYEKDDSNIDINTLIINHLDNFDERVVAKKDIIEKESGNYLAKPEDEIILKNRLYKPIKNQSIRDINFDLDSKDFEDSKLIIKNYRYDQIIKYKISHYNKKDYKKIIDSEIIEGRFGNIVTESAKNNIDGYNALEPKVQKLFLGDKDIIQEIIFMYEEDDDEEGGGGGNITPEPKPEPEEPEKKPEEIEEDKDEEERPDWGNGGIGPDGKELDLDNLEPEIIAKELNFIDHYNYIIGYPDETIRPNNNITREEVATVTLRIMNKDFINAVNTTEHEFTDISINTWSERYIATMSRINILNGYKDGTFKPKSDMTRAELAVLVSRINNLDEEDMSEKNIFKDTKGHWAVKPINIAAEKGWIEGYKDGNFRPNDSITRAELVTLINNMLERHTDIENMLDDRKEYKDLEKFRWYYEAMQEAITPHEYIEEDGKEIWTNIYEEVHDVFGVVTYKHDKSKIKN